MIPERVISTSSLEWHEWESCIAWWAHRTSRHWWYTAFWSVRRTIWSSLQSTETSYPQMVRTNHNDLGSVIKVRLLEHSTNTVSPTDVKQSNDMDDDALVGSPGVLVRVQFHFVLDDYGDEYGMNSMIKRYLVNCNLASVGWSYKWWNAGVPGWWLTKSNSEVPYNSLCENLSQLQSLLILYCLCGIVIPQSGNGIRVLRCTWTSKCDSKYSLLVYSRRTRHKNC